MSKQADKIHLTSGQGGAYCDNKKHGASFQAFYEAEDSRQCRKCVSVADAHGYNTKKSAERVKREREIYAQQTGGF